jgi:pantoate--beta-alanine ligase
MEIISTAAGWRSALDAARRDGRHVGFVPTMGALHAGHASLVDAARSACDLVTTSIFVNPLQFGDASDLDAYPRTLEADAGLLEAHGCDVLFAPTVTEMYPHYPEASRTTVHVTGAAEGFEGADRPGHFDGMATVVALLFNLAGPCAAYFGEKDFQQLAVVRQMVVDLGQPIDVVGCPTAREPDGLAMSSRNVRLTPSGRAAAPVIHAALQAGAAAATAGADGPGIGEAMAALIRAEPAASLFYAAAVEPDTLAPLAETAPGDAVRLLIAASIDDVRLIDNLAATVGPAR